MHKKICVVGAGYWGSNHIKTLKKIGSLAGVVEVDKKVVKVISEKNKKIKTHIDLEEALSVDYDGFIVATPAETHFKIAKKIIEAGKHVLIEKPMVLSANHAETLLKLGKKNKTNIMVGHVLLFHPAIAKIKALIDGGRIGHLQYIYSNRLNLGKVRTQENVFWSLAPHDIAIFQFFTNSYPEKISATGSSILQKKILDSTITHLEFSNGVKGHIFVSWLHPFKEHRLVIIGSEAMISFEDSNDSNSIKLYSKKFDLSKGVPEKIDGPVQNITYENNMPLDIEIDYFVKNMSSGFQISNAFHGYEVIKILEEASLQLLND